MKKQVLLVEDTKLLAASIADILIMEGFEVTIAENGKDALQIIKNHPIDIVITDIVMPEMDGITFVKFVRAQAHLVGIPIIVLSAKVFNAQEQEEKAGGADLFIQKPCDLEFLVSSITRLIK